MHGQCSIPDATQQNTLSLCFALASSIYSYFRCIVAYATLLVRKFDCIISDNTYMWTFVAQYSYWNTIFLLEYDQMTNASKDIVFPVLLGYSLIWIIGFVHWTCFNDWYFPVYWEHRDIQQCNSIKRRIIFVFMIFRIFAWRPRVTFAYWRQK